jgi:voltage-gated potassium channel
MPKIRDMRFSRHNVLNVGVLRLPEPPPLPGLLKRIFGACAIILLVAIGLWFDRDGLSDNAHPGRPMTFPDVLYFTVVSLTTVGYGDIAPVTQEARLVNALLLTPVRVFLWALFLGVAYELTLQRLREKSQMDKLRQRLKNHIIVCGFGVKGRAVITDLIAHGYSPEEIVVIEPSEGAAQEAAAQGLTAITGDASAESILRAAAIEKASHVIAAPSRDDVCVLICLTVRALAAPSLRLIASAREEENIKLIYRAGADMVIASSVSGGRLMASAVGQTAAPEFLEDIIHFGQGVDATEYVVPISEAGKHAADLPLFENRLILGVQRGKTRYHFQEAKSLLLQPGDVVVYLITSA